MSTETKRRRTAAKSADTAAVLRGPIVEEPAPLASQVVERSRSAVIAYEAWVAANKLSLELDEKDGDEAPQARAAARRADRLSEEADQLIEYLISTKPVTADELVEKAALMWPMLYRGESRADMTLHERYGQSVALDVQRLLGREAAAVEVAAPIETIAADMEHAERPPIVPGRGQNAHLPGAKSFADETDLLGPSIRFGLSVDDGLSAASTILDALAANTEADMANIEGLRWVLQKIGEDTDQFNAVVLGAQAEGLSHV